MKAIVGYLSLLILHLAFVCQADQVIDPCHSPQSKECQDISVEIYQNKSMFEEEFYNETSIIMDQFLEEHPELNDTMLNKVWYNNKELMKKLVNVLFEKGLEMVAKAIRYHQKDLQKIFLADPLDLEDIEPQMWKASVLTETLEKLVQNSTKLPKPEIYDVLTDLTNARVVAEDYVVKLSGNYAERVKDNIKRIEKIEKLIDSSN